MSFSKTNDDLKKFTKYTSSTVLLDKYVKTIGYALGLLSATQKKKTPWSIGLGQLSNQISMARYVIRFPGFFESYEALKNDSWSLGTDDENLKQIVKLQAYSMLLYYPLEHASFVGWTAPRLFNIDADKHSRNSCCLWTIYVLLDIYAIQLRIQQISKESARIRNDESLKVEEIQAKLTELSARQENLYWNLVRDLLYLPNAIHWSTKNGILPPKVVQFLGLAEAVVGAWRSWINL